MTRTQTIFVWFYGLLSAAIGAAANTVTVMIVAPETFNIHEGLDKVFTVAGVSAVVAAAAYLKTSPLPGCGPIYEDRRLAETPGAPMRRANDKPTEEKKT
jgi:hypothetical protein